MKTILFFVTLAFAGISFASNSFVCENADGKIQLVPTTPCNNCDPNLPAFDFIGGEGVLAAGIPEYDSEMPGYIDFNTKSTGDEDVISLIDGGTWWIDIRFPKGTLQQQLKKEQKVDVLVDSTYSDINEDEVVDVPMTCTVQ